MLKHAFKILLLMAALAVNFDAQATKSFYVITGNFSLNQFNTSAGSLIESCSGDTITFKLVPNNSISYSSLAESKIHWKILAYDGADNYYTATATGSSITLQQALIGGSNSGLQVNIDSAGLINTNINQVYQSPSLDLGRDIGSCPGTTAFLKNYSVTSGNFRWNTGSTATGITVNLPGLYTATVTSFASPTKNCYAIDAVTFTHHPKPEIQIDAINGVRYKCFNEPLQLNVAFANPGTPPYAWSWKEADFLNSDVIQNPVVLNTLSQNSKSYTVIGIDANNCKDTSKVIVNKNPQFKATINQVNVTLCKFVSILLPVNIDKPGGGSAASDYKYKWSPNIGLSNDSIKSPTVSAISVSGISYILTVTDLNFCTAKDTVIITRSTFEMNFTNPFEEVKTICSGEVISNLSISRKVGIGPFTFDWQPVNILNKINDSLYNSKPITQSQKILVTVTDNNGCKDKDSLIVTIKPLPASEIPNGENTICVGSEKQVAVIAESESLNYNITWSPNLRISSTNSYKPTFTGDATESATPQLYVVTVTSKENNCSLVDSLRLVTKPFTAFTIEEPSDNIVETESSFKGSVSELQYQWLVTTIGGIPIAPQPTVNNLQTLTYKFTSTGFYTLSASGTNSFGCSQIVTKEIEILNPSTKILYVPTIFSPAAANNCNKALYVFCTKTDIVSGSFKLSVFTPTGQKIFESTDLEKMAVENINNCTDVSPDKGWSGDDYPTGVYSMVVECKFNNKDKTAYKKANPVTLLR